MQIFIVDLLQVVPIDAMTKRAPAFKRYTARAQFTVVIEVTVPPVGYAIYTASTASNFVGENSYICVPILNYFLQQLDKNLILCLIRECLLMRLLSVMRYYYNFCWKILINIFSFIKLSLTSLATLKPS